MKQLLKAFLVPLFAVLLMTPFAVFITAQTQKIESVYTDLSAEKCETIESNEEEAGSYLGECPGVGGYNLELLEGDIRQTINVIAPNDRKSELEFWSNVSSAFSAVGEKAEWRVTRDGNAIKPFALIVRYNTNEDGENPEKITSRLIVIKIVRDSACITDVVEPVADANSKARELADASAKKACKFEIPGKENTAGDAKMPVEDETKTIGEEPENQNPPDLIVADVADYSKGTVPIWKKFASEAALEKAREQQESYTIAYIWKNDGKVSQVNFTYFSESGDWVEYWFHTYREDGSLAKVTDELRTFMNDIIVNRTRTYDKNGKVIEERKTFRDLNTQKIIPPKEYIEVDAGQLYLKVSDLPFSSMVGSATANKTDESAFIPSGWMQESKESGDLNGDSIADSVLQIKLDNDEQVENDRKLIILFKTSDGGYTKVAEAGKLLICSACGGVKGGPPDIEIKNGVLSISQLSGSRAFSSYLHRFRFEPSSGKFLLIGEDLSESDGTGSSESTSTNYLTGKQKVTKTKYDEQKDEDVVVSSKTRSVSKSKKYLEEVGL